MSSAKKVRALVGVAVAATALLLPHPTAARAADDAELAVTAVDVSAFPEVVLELSVVGHLEDVRLGVGDVAVREERRIRPVTTVEALGTEGLEVVLVVDRSGSMSGAPIVAARAAATAFVQQLPQDVPIGLVTFGRDARLVLAPTTDHPALVAEIAAIPADGGTALYDGVTLAARQFSSASARRALVVLSDGGDTASAATLDQAVAAVTGAQVHVIELVTEESNPLALAALAGPTPVRSAEDPAALTGIYGDVAGGLVNRTSLTYRSALAPGQQGQVVVDVEVGGVRRTATVTVTAPAAPTPPTTAPVAAGPAAVVTPPSSTTPTTRTPAPSSTAAPAADAGRPAPDGPPLAGVALVFGGLAVTVGALRVRPGVSMRDRLRVRPETAVVAPPVPEEERASAPLGRAVGRALDHAGWRRRLAAALEAAASPLTPTDVVIRTALGSGLVALVVGVAVHPVLGVLAAGLVPLGVRWRIQQAAARRRRAFVEQLPDLLQVVCSMLRSGYGLLQALDAAAAEATDPTKEWLQRALMEVRTGRDLASALRSLADRVGSVDFHWVVAAIEINREVGGDLARTFETLADTIRERDRLRRQVRTLTAEGRMSAYMMLALPPIVALLSGLANPDFFGVLLKGAGLVLLALAVVLMAVGWYWMHKIVSKVV